ncbi:hypothetical protein BC830DRAFT_1169567 [Chytriomyces sp. MP71]|nr:hypothetical protein BC830DRAFT_1169567 [Chytriomyces sp. MP71]
MFPGATTANLPSQSMIQSAAIVPGATVTSPITPAAATASVPQPPALRTPIQRRVPGLLVQPPPPYQIELPSLFPLSRELPPLLSTRFNRGATIKKTSRRGAPRVTDSPATPNKTIPIGMSLAMPNALLIGGVGIIDSPTQGGAEGGDKKKGAAGRGKDSGDDTEATPAVLNPDDSYTPFHLSDKSSFNLAKVSTRQVRKMDRVTLAKYKAYEKPTPNIVQNIDESSARAKALLKHHHKRIQEECSSLRILLERKKGHIEVGEEGRAQEEARRAMDRMKDKHARMNLARETELAFLVEGQPNSIDAIRLKEYLSTKAATVRNKSYTDRDRLRVEELLSIRHA